MSQGLFTRIARYPIRPDRNDLGEDRLTEIFAAVLDHPSCADLAQFLVTGWVGAALESDRGDRDQLLAVRDRLQNAEWACQVTTQAWISVAGQNRRPDLLLHFHRPDEAAIRICVEVKHGTDPHTQQLHAYAANLELLVGQTLVVLVAPRASFPFKQGEIPPEVPQLSWQETATLLKRYQLKSGAGKLLVSELLNYLMEEALMDPDRITPEHLVAITHYREAFTGLVLIGDIADAYVGKTWPGAAQPDETKMVSGEGWWAYSWVLPETGQLQNWHLNWNVFKDSARYFRDGRPGVPRITAGAYAEFGTLDAMAMPLKEQLSNEGLFDLIRHRDLQVNSWDRIWRTADPEDVLEDVLEDSPLEAQGQAVGRWIVDAFRSLEGILAQHPGRAPSPAQPEHDSSAPDAITGERAAADSGSSACARGDY